jgi:hypothetical protein
MDEAAAKNQRQPRERRTAAAARERPDFVVSTFTSRASNSQALAGVFGPLIEVPALVGLVYVSLWAKRRFLRREDPARRSDITLPPGAYPHTRLGTSPGEGK